MRKHHPFILAVIFLSFSSSIFCQNKTFNVGLIAGLNFSELEGEEITDYFGVNTGVLSTMKLSKNFQLGLELLYSQNGEYILPKYHPQINYGKIRLNHIEIPIHLDWLVRIFKKDNFHNVNFNLGVAYTRLLNYYAEDSQNREVTEDIIYDKKDALLAQAGLVYSFTKNIGLNLKATLPIRVTGVGWTLAARIIYTV